MNLRIACSTEEFRRQLKETYVKYLIETLCIKSRQTRNAVFWLFNFLKKLKLFRIKKSLFSSNNNSMIDTNDPQLPPPSPPSPTPPPPPLFHSSRHNQFDHHHHKQHKKHQNHHHHHHNQQFPTTESFLFTSASSTSIFEFKFFYYYYINNLNMPLIPFSYDVQKVFHSVSFAYLLDLIGIVRTDKAFPFIPKEWFHKGRKELNDCLNSLEKCLCI